MTKRVFGTLDGIRGIAALCIVVLHAHRYFNGSPLPSAHLAVDLFYALSGFVLAHAYEGRFEAGLTPLRFFLMRVARLYPIYLMGIVLGIVDALLAIQFQIGAIPWSWSSFLTTLPFAILFLPTPFGNNLFPLNGVMWSIFFELLINLIWALFWRPLRSTKVITFVVAGSGLGLIVAAYWFNTMALGTGWHTFIGGLARVSYSFMLGVLLYRVRRARVLHIPSSVLLIALPVLLAFHMGVTAQLLCALFILPLFVLFGSQVEPNGYLPYICQKLGAASYPVYAVHMRMYRLSYAFMLFFGFHAEAYAPWTGFVFLALLIFGCVIVAQVFDPPARRFLNQLLLQPLQYPAKNPTF